MPVNKSEVQSFMDRQRLASIATVDIRNQPHVVPIFFTYRSGKVYVQSDRNSVKVRNLSHNNCVAVAVYSGEEAVIIRGKGRLVESDEEFVRRTQEHIDKYKLKLDECGRDSLGIPLFDKKIRCVIEVVGERIIFW
jgi:nitroimidazol reductase NimA-like FMN-containing flavoprotein (pyridoxamine 5'-phosphate oxidase superfamily)